MTLNKIGSPSKIKVVKYSGFSVDPNFLAQTLLKDWPSKKLSVDDLHLALKSIGVINYSSDDLSVLIGRLEAVGFSISR
jgi:hypothetical protein